MAQKDFEQIQYQEQTLESELERLRSQSARIDEALARASLVRSSQGIPSANLDEFKRRLFGLLNDPNYRWQDNMPFVRVRKSDLKELGPAMAFSESGGIQDWGAEVLGLTLQERTALEGALRAHADAYVRNSRQAGVSHQLRCPGAG